MTRLAVITAVTAAAVVTSAAPLAGPAAASAAAVARSAAGVVQSGGTWGKAIEVAGDLSKGHANYTGINSVSCDSAGSCAAGGSYADRSGRIQAFVVIERNGRWGTAVEVPGSGALNKGGDAQVTSVSCGPAGNCAAGGSYQYRRLGNSRAFVVTERNGRWGTAIEVPGFGALNKGGAAQVTSVSCGSARYCVAGGYGAPGGQAFVVSERNGRWGKAIEVAGGLAKGGAAQVNSVSCSSARNCAAGGQYIANNGGAFVVSERNGRWGKAIEVAGGLNSKDNGAAGVNSVSCRVAGDCAAGGAYIDSGGGDQPFVVSEQNGHWGKAVQLAAGVYGTVLSVSCASAVYCTAGGFRGSAGPSKAFVVSERNGRWGNALEIPGWGELNTEGYAGVNSLSCPSPGNCAAGGPYYDRSGAGQAFVASEVNGHWADAIEVPGSAALNTGGNAHVASVSCATAGQCAAGGSYYVGSGTHLGAQSFVATQK